jgi:hypothetical protein
MLTFLSVKKTKTCHNSDTAPAPTHAVTAPLASSCIVMADDGAGKGRLWPARLASLAEREWYIRDVLAPKGEAPAPGTVCESCFSELEWHCS